MSHKYNQNRYNNGFSSYPFTQALSDSLTPTEAITKFAVGKGLSDSISFTDALPKAITILKTDTLTTSETIAKAVTTQLTDSVTLSDVRAAGQYRTFSDGIALGDHLLTIEAEISDTVRLEDWISLHLIKPGVWTEDTNASGSWTEASPSADPSWTQETPPSDDPWSH